MCIIIYININNALTFVRVVVTDPDVVVGGVLALAEGGVHRLVVFQRMHGVPGRVGRAEVHRVHRALSQALDGEVGP
jgi:hypothetical protein